jgi:hypothetical protein
LFRDVGWDGLLDFLLFARLARVVDVYEERVLRELVSSNVVWQRTRYTDLVAARLLALVFCHLAAQHLVGSIFSDHCSHVSGASLRLFVDKTVCGLSSEDNAFYWQK